MHRLQHLMKSEGFDGIRNVNLESQCFQLDENGEIFRLVYLGLTDNELLIVTQSLPDYKNAMEAVVARVDLELEGLKLISSIPLECIQFYVVDDRSRKFVVCTCLGEVEYFEVCNTPDGSDTAWLKWRELFSQRDNPFSCGYKRWRFTSSNQRCKNELEFIRRPFPFYCVESVGIQTTNETGETKSPNALIKESKLEEKLFKVTSPFINTDPIHCAISQSNVRSDHRNCSLKRSKSCSDLLEGRPTSKTVYSYLVFSLVYQNFNGDRDKAQEEFLYLFPQWSEMEKMIHYFSQIVKYQTRERQRWFSESVDVRDSASEESITDLIDGYRQNESSAQQVNKNWMKLKNKILENVRSNAKTKFEKTVDEVVFKMCDNKNTTKNFTSYKPHEFAAEIVLMSSKLVACISYFDFISLYNGKMERSVENLMAFFHNLSQLVSTDVLHHTFTTEILKILIFYIKVGEVCLAMGDYQTCRSVILGLHSPRIHLLTEYWKDLQCKHQQEYRLLRELSDRVLVPRNYMKHFRSHYSEEKTRLPLLDHLLSHVWKAHLSPDRFKDMLYRTLTIRATVKRKPTRVKLHRVKSSLTNLRKKIKLSKEKIKEETEFENPESVKEAEPHKISSTADDQKTASVFPLQVKVADDFSNKILQEALEIIRNDPNNLEHTINDSGVNEVTEERYLSTHFKQRSDGHISRTTIGPISRAKKKKGKHTVQENEDNASAKEYLDNKCYNEDLSETKRQSGAVVKEGEKKMKDDLDKKEDIQQRGGLSLSNKEKGNKKKKAKEETKKLNEEKEKRKKYEKEEKKKKEKEKKEKKMKKEKKEEVKGKEKKEEKEIQGKDGKGPEDKKAKELKGRGKKKTKKTQKEGSETEKKIEKIEGEYLDRDIQDENGTKLEKNNFISRQNETEKFIPPDVREDGSKEAQSEVTKNENIKVEIDDFGSIASTSKSPSQNVDDLDTRYITTRHRYSGDGGRRKSLFEEAADDENVLKIKEASIDEAVEKKIKDVRRGSIFDESYLDHEEENKTRVPIKSVLKSPTQSDSEIKRNKRTSIFGSIFSSHGDVSFVSSLFSAISRKTSSFSLRSKSSSDSAGKNKKSVRFEDNVSIAQYNINASNDTNTNFTKAMNNTDMCELCRGKCIYNADPFKEILKSQLLAVAYINSKASKPGLRRLIEERLK